ncbi:MAG: hypothetical protein ACLPSW_09275 [Roseiarcus sp.]
MHNRLGRPTGVLASLRSALATAPQRIFAARAPRDETRALGEIDRVDRPPTVQARARSPNPEELVAQTSMARSLRLAASSACAGADAAVTIAARTRGLLTPSLDGSGAQAREARRMVEEKVAAACEGALAAQVAWGTFLFSAAFGGVRTAEDAALGLADVAEAALAPAHRTVRANARRLTGA